MAGGVMLVGLGRLLPDRRSARARFSASIREFSVTMEVVAGGALDGRTVAEAGLRALEGVYRLSILQATS